MKSTEKPEPDSRLRARLPNDSAKSVIDKYHQVVGAAMGDAETLLRESALSQAIAEAMPDALVVVDELGRISAVNTQFELMFGYHRSEITGRNVEVLLPETFRADHVALRQEYVKDPHVRDLHELSTLRARRKNGLEFPVQVKLGPVVIPSGIFTIAIIRRGRE